MGYYYRDNPLKRWLWRARRWWRDYHNPGVCRCIREGTLDDRCLVGCWERMNGPP